MSLTTVQAQNLGEALKRIAKPHMPAREYADLLSAVTHAAGCRTTKAYMAFSFAANAVIPGTRVYDDLNPGAK